MKIQIDTINKKINVESNIKLKDLFEFLNQIFPNETWKEYELECNTVINYSYSTIVYPWKYNDYYPFYITNKDTTAIYNFDVIDAI
jgi:hypothetical protein